MALTNWNYAPANADPGALGVRDYLEGKDSYSIDFTPGGGITRVYYCNYSIFPNFMDDLLGVSYVNNAGTGISWLSLPDCDNLYSNCYATTATMEPMGLKGKIAVTNIPDNRVAKITVKYGQADYAVKADGAITNELDRFVTRVGGYDGEMFNINNTAMRFVSNVGADGKHQALTQPPARMTGVQQWTYIWRYVPAVNSNPFRVPNNTALQNCSGKVHAFGGSFVPNASYSFDKNNNAFLPGTVLFVGAEPKMYTSRPVTGQRNGNFAWEIAMRFLVRDNGLVSRTTAGQTINERAGHCFIWDQSLAQWDLITGGSDAVSGTMAGTRLYENADLNTLFTIG